MPSPSLHLGLKDEESRNVHLKQFLLCMNLQCCKGALKKASVIICKITVLEDFIKSRNLASFIISHNDSRRSEGIKPLFGLLFLPGRRPTGEKSVQVFPGDIQEGSRALGQTALLGAPKICTRFPRFFVILIVSW